MPLGREGRTARLGLRLVAVALAAIALAACEASRAGDIATTAPTSRIATVRERGVVVCAGANSVPGYGFLDDTGRNVGFDVDLCRAVAAAVLGDAEAIRMEVIQPAERGPSLQSGDIDLLVRTVTWTTSRDAQWGNFTHTMFYDGQGFMVTRNLGVNSAYELGGAAVCVTSGTTTELNLADFFRQNDVAYNPTVFEQNAVSREAYRTGQCDAITGDRSQLAASRTTVANPDDHVILPETISEEPLTPVVPHGDEQWFDIVKAVMAGLIYAEAYGVTSDNVSRMASGDNVNVKRLLGSEGSFGQETLGLPETFMQGVIATVGNYGEIYDRNLGAGGIGLKRTGRNRLWLDGGQIYAPLLR